MSTTPKIEKTKPAARAAKSNSTNGKTARAIPEELLNRTFPDPLGRTPEQILIDRERILAKSRPPKPVPGGGSAIAYIMGKWPGDETDEEIEEALKWIS